MKILQSISLSKEITEDVKARRKQGTFNFSEWIDLEYRSKFMSKEAKQLEINKNIKRNKVLRKEIKEVELRQKTFMETITQSERRFLSTIPRLLKKGCDWESLGTRFNISFNKEFTINKIRSIVRYLENDKK